MRSSLLVAAAVALTFHTPCQDVMGLLNNTDTSFTSRGSATGPNTNPSFAFVRIDQEHYGGWGYDPANPGQRAIQGIRVVLQDQIGSTPETFGVLIYGEDPAQPDYPDISTSLGGVSGVPVTGTAAGAQVSDVLVTFATPILVPAGTDVYPAVDLPQPTGAVWPTDGLSVHALYYGATTSGTFDAPGGSHPTATQYGNSGYHVPAIPQAATYTTTPRQWKIEPILAGATGVAGTVTNQTSAPQSNTAPGSSSMASGLHPDAVSPPLNAGRVDDISNRWFRSSAADGTVVLFFFDLGPLGLELPGNLLVPGSTGLACLNTTSAEFVGIGLTLAGEASYTIPIPAGVRPILGGLSVSHQAAALNAAGGGVDLGICTRQVL